MKYEITVKFQSNDSITQSDLDDWDDNGSITLEEYAQFILDNRMLFDVIDDYKDIELVDVKQLSDNKGK